VLQQELRNGRGRLRWDPHLRDLFGGHAHLCHQHVQGVHSGFELPIRNVHLHQQRL
jgi:hypothetical protein